MLCKTIHCSVLQYTSEHCSTVWCSTETNSSEQNSSVQYHAVFCLTPAPLVRPSASRRNSWPPALQHALLEVESFKTDDMRLAGRTSDEDDLEEALVKRKNLHPGPTLAARIRIPGGCRGGFPCLQKMLRKEKRARGSNLGIRRPDHSLR